MVGNLGKIIRMNRLFHSKSGRMISIMLDHSIARGVLPGLENIRQVIKNVADGYPNAMSMVKGIADSCFESVADRQISLIMKASSPAPFDKSYAAMIGDVEDAVIHGADAIAIGCILGGSKQAKSLEQAATVISEANKYGIPVVGHFYPNGETIPVAERELCKNIIYAARCGAEIGVDILKIHHNGMDLKELKEIVNAIPAKIVLAGGSPGNNVRHYLQMAHNICEAGGAGVAFGRAAWGFENPALFIKAVKMIVHEDVTVGMAMEFLEDSLNKKL